jgi:hypothetical protein
VVPKVFILYVVVLNCTSDASCGAKNIYDSYENAGESLFRGQHPIDLLGTLLKLSVEIFEARTGCLYV